jgi:Protein of unknown function (DUF2975)
MKATRSVENALAPLEFILSVAIALMVFFTVLSIPLILFGSGSLFGLGDADVCLAAPQSAVGAISGHGGINGEHLDVYHGVSTIAANYTLCDANASWTQHVWSALTMAPTFFYALGFLALAWHLTRMARSRGLFSPEVALGVGRLGLYVLLGVALVAALESVASWRLLATMRAGTSAGDILSFVHLSWAILFAGFGLLTVGRVMAQSVRMQREIAATV